MNTSQFHFLSKSVRQIMAATPLAASGDLVRHGTSRNWPWVVLHCSPGGRGAADRGVAVERRPLPEPVTADEGEKSNYADTIQASCGVCFLWPRVTKGISSLLILRHSTL